MSRPRRASSSTQIPAFISAPANTRAEYDLNLNSVKAGTTIHIKGDKAIFNSVGASATNVEGGDLILEAAGGSIGGPDDDDKLYIDLDPSATVTASCPDDIHLVERDRHHEPGNRVR